MIDHHQPPGIAQVAPASVRGFLAVFHLDAVYGDAFFGGGDGVVRDNGVIERLRDIPGFRSRCIYGLRKNSGLQAAQFIVGAWGLGGIDIIFLGIFTGDFGGTFLFDIFGGVLPVGILAVGVCLFSVFGGTNGSTISDTSIIFLRILAGNVFRRIRSVLGDIRRSIIIAFAEIRLLCLLCVYTLRGIIFCAVSQGAAVHPGRQDNTQKKSG
ncbi:MAG: hypothetical protein IJJ38_04545 [Lachnospiraceae bacterium]|nr:hypothetical protein [Lachnospiraceae bacterium]